VEAAARDGLQRRQEATVERERREDEPLGEAETLDTGGAVGRAVIARHVVLVGTLGAGRAATAHAVLP
jgi:hypothetical protein